MPLTSPSFLLFLCAVAAAYWLAPARARIGLLLAASYAWYLAADPYFLILLLGTTAFDFQVAKALEGMSAKDKKRPYFLAASLCGNLAVLLFFKFSPAIAPLGVSFYTFHSISYVVDVYRGTVRAERSFPRYALYVAFFPKIVAGPIERFADFSKQLLNPRPMSLDLFWQGSLRILFGLFLKLVVGDSLALLVGDVFDKSLVDQSRLGVLLGIYAYSAQIYADFLGYTLIARGGALFFGFELEKNFLSPYLASSPQDFWRRWHRSLSFWFRDYVYIPLGGNRKRWALNILITMVLAGLWHGAAPTFIVWGLYHAAVLILASAWTKAVKPIIARSSHAYRTVLMVTAWCFTLQAVCFGWVFFRAATLVDAVSILRLAIFGAGSNAGDAQIEGAAKLFLLLVLPWILFGLARIRGWLPNWQLATLAAKSTYALCAGICLVAILILGDASGSPFIYFRF